MYAAIGAIFFSAASYLTLLAAVELMQPSIRPLATNKELSDQNCRDHITQDRFTTECGLLLLPDGDIATARGRVRLEHPSDFFQAEISSIQFFRPSPSGMWSIIRLCRDEACADASIYIIDLKNLKSYTAMTLAEPMHISWSPDERYAAFTTKFCFPNMLSLNIDDNFGSSMFWLSGAEEKNCINKKIVWVDSSQYIFFADECISLDCSKIEKIESTFDAKIYTEPSPAEKPTVDKNRIDRMPPH